MSGFIKSLFSAGDTPTDGEMDSPYSAFSALPASGSSANCANCGIRRRGTDPGVYDPSYCGPSCAGEPDYSAASDVWEDGNMCARPGCDEQIPPTAQFCSKEHAKAAVVDGQVPGCDNCHVLPTLPGKRWCSDACEARAASSPPPAKKPQATPEPPAATEDKDALIRQRFTKRWSDPVNRTTPTIHKLQEISLRPPIQERWDRCTQALEDRGGFTIKSTFYGGPCECALASEDPRSNPCKSVTCLPCRVVRSAFAESAKAPAHLDQGVCGSGIYTKMNPAHAHLHTDSPSGNVLRVIILCSVAVPKVPSNDGSGDPVVEENGRCFCPDKDNIIPRWVIVYEASRPKPPPSPQVRKVSNATFNPPASPSSPRPGTPSGKDTGSLEKDRKIRQLEAKIKWLEQALKDEREKNKDLTNKLAMAKAAPPPTPTPGPKSKPVDGLPDFPPSPTKPDSSSKGRRRANSLPGTADALPDSPPPKARKPKQVEDDELPDLPPGRDKKDRRTRTTSTSDFEGFSDKRGPRRKNRDKRKSDFDGLPDNPPGAFPGAFPDDLPEFPPWDPSQGFGSGPGGFPPQPNFGWGPQPVPPPGWGGPPPFGGFQPYGPPQPPAPAPSLALCILKGCNKPVHEAEGKFCSNQHRKDAVTKDGMPPCILCKEYPKAISQFCGQKCLAKAQGQAPMLISVDQKDPMFNNIVNQFDLSWRHTNKTKPAVVFVYKIVLSKQLTDSYLAYQNKVESEGNFTAQGKSPGNECRRWHGTKRLCNIGDTPANPTLCTNTACPMCSILRTSFQVAKTNASGRTFNRFGKGVYASSTSSKAFDYATNGGPASQYSMIMLTNVIVGQGYKLTQDSTGLTAPPNGYHSVLGETGGSLNHDEVVVYNDDAIRPSWLVVYK